jgi:hypothetical protein
MSSLFLIFNHQFTSTQEVDARTSLDVKKIVPLPTELQERWSGIPPFLPTLKEYLEPFRVWLASQAATGDFSLIQGDFGACYLLVHFALNQGLIPVYSTTQREAEEEILPDGTVRLIHHFEHQIFRRYGE